MLLAGWIEHFKFTAFNVFTMFNGVILLTEINILEGVHLVDVSRRIFQRLVETNEFEVNFCQEGVECRKHFLPVETLH